MTEIVPSIVALAGVCPSKDGDERENILSEHTPVKWVKALGDTGATNSSISDPLANELNLIEEDFVKIATAAGIIRVPVHFIHLFLPQRQLFQGIEVIQFNYTDDECDIIIGMDIITQGDLSITNLEGKTVFSFRMPSMHRVDFEAESKMG